MDGFKCKRFFLTILSFLAFTLVYSQSVNATTFFQPQESESETKSIAGTTITDSNTSTHKTAKLQPDSNTFYHDKNIWIIGDSLAVGWDGKRTVPKNYPTLIGEKLEPKVLQDSYASSGSQISGNQDGTPTYDMSNNVQRVINDKKFSDADILIIELGVNDLNYSSNNLGYVQQRLQHNIKRLRKANPKVKIFGILPFASYQKNKASQYSVNNLKEALTKVYNSFGIPVLNWKNTKVAHGPSKLGDHLVHPTQATYKKMANAISDWLLKDSNLNVNEHDSTLTFVSNGWQVDEQGKRQYAKNNKFVIGFKNIDGKTYYFDPKTKGLLENQFISSDGVKYYADSDGSVIKSSIINKKDIQIIKDKAYEINYFGKTNLSTKTGYLSTRQGWLWLEHGELFTGFRKYLGAFYYFENGVRQENKWVSEWGHRYYVGKNGRSVEGNKVSIDGKTYDFGNNHTFYLR